VTPILVFDLETIPDIPSIRKINGILSNVNDEEVVKLAQYQRRQKVGNDFLQHQFQKIVSISCVLKTDESLEVWSVGDKEMGEAELLKRFMDGIDKYIPNLITWGGSGFDLPVLNYRLLANKIKSNTYFDMGEGNSDFKWNNYLSRYHKRHLDLMDYFALYNGRNNASLDHICKISGFPGKLDMDGGHVWQTFLRGDIELIRNYCETDVANTYLIYLRFMLIKNEINLNSYDDEITNFRKVLEDYSKPHWVEFLKAWKS